MRSHAIAACVLAAGASLAALGCGGSDSTTKTTVTTREAPNPSSGAPVRLTYLPDSPYGRQVTDAQLDRGVAILEQRAKDLGLNDTRVRKSDGKIVVTYSPKDFADPANSQLPVQGRLYFYDFEADVIGDPTKPVGDIYEAVTKASGQKPVDSPDNTTAEQHYLFGSLHNYQGGPAGSRDALLERFRGNLPQGARVISVPPGTIAVLAHPLANSLDPKAFNGDFIVRDRPQLDNSDIRDPRFVDSDGKPGVQFDFTLSGRVAFQRLTRQVARAGGAGTPHQVAVVLDTAILSKVSVPPDRYPNGIDGRDGAVLSGDLDDEQAKDLAAVLASGPLPFRLIPLLQEQVRSG